MCADPGQKTGTRTNFKNMALITSMVIRRIKDRCGQVISVRYPNKENHDRKKDETDSKGMMIFARPSGSGYPSQLKAIISIWIHNGILSAAYSVLQGFSYPAGLLDMVSVEYPSLFCQIQDSFATSAV